MAVVRRADLVICGEQWATSRAADRTYSHIMFHSGGWDSSSHTGGLVSGSFLCRCRTPAASEWIWSVAFLYNAHFIVINFQRQLVWSLVIRPNNRFFDRFSIKTSITSLVFTCTSLRISMFTAGIYAAWRQLNVNKFMLFVVCLLSC